MSRRAHLIRAVGRRLARRRSQAMPIAQRVAINGAVRDGEAGCTDCGQPLPLCRCDEERTQP